MVVLYEKNAASFEDNGLCVLSPASCVVSEVAGGQYELELTHPFDKHGKYLMLTDERIIKAPVPPTVIPEITLPELKIWKTTTATDLMSKTPTTRYNNENWAILLRVKANPTAFAWTGSSYMLYNTGAIALLGGIVYRALKSNSGVSPNSDSSIWQSLGSINDLNPIVDGGRVVESLAANVVIYKIANAGKDYIKVKTLSGKMGFVAKADCEETVQTYQEVIPEQTITDQLFRIYETDCDEDTNTLVVHAKHVFYDMAGNSTYDCKITEAEPNEAIAALQSALVVEDLRTIACNITGKKITQDWSFKNPISALLDPDSGLVSTLKAKLIRNNDAVYILDAASPRTGITIAYGHNMLGVSWTRSIENVIIRVIPRSGDADKGYMYIENGGRISGGAVQDQGKNYVESAAADDFCGHVPRVELMNCSYTVGEEYEKPDGTKAKYTEADVRAKMLEDALNRFTVDGVDGAEITLDVEFLLMGDTEEYKQYRGLQTVCLYDVITVKTGKSGIDMTAQVTGYEFDCLRKRYNHITVGTVNSFTKRVPGYKVVNESITYEKLSPDLINRILTANASSSTDSGSSGSGASGGLVTIVEKNSASADGIVTKGSGQASKVWKTDANGNPAWRDESAAQTVTDNDPTLAWGTRSKVGSVGNTDLHVTMPADVKVNRAGDTMTGNLYVEKSSGSVDVSSENTTTSVKVMLKVGEGGANHGIYSYGYYNGSSFVSDPKWMISRTGTGDIVVNGDAATVNGHSVNKDVPSDAVFTDHYDWSDITNKPGSFYTLPLAADGTRGGVQIGYTQSGKNYPVQLSSEKMFVYVPWTDTTYSAGSGISLSGTTFSNSGVRSVSINGDNLRVNTNGTNNDLIIPYATKSRYSEADNNAKNPGGALLRSGSGRTDTSPDGDTWLYWDTLGGTSTPWGIRHDQGANTFSFIGGGTVRAVIAVGESKITATTFAGNATSASSAPWSGITDKPATATRWPTWDEVTDKPAFNYLPLAGGSMTGASGIQFPTAAGPSKTGNWISAGGGYSTGSGKSGLKILACEQSDAEMGLGADLTGGPYELTVVAMQNGTNYGKICFATHTMAAKTTYTLQGMIDINGNYIASGNLYAGKYAQNTSQSKAHYVGAKSGAGVLQLESDALNEEGMRLSATLANGTSLHVFTVDQSGNVDFYKSAKRVHEDWGKDVTIARTHALVLVNSNIRVQVWLSSTNTISIWFERFTSTGTRYEFYKTGNGTVSFGDSSATGTTKYMVTRSGSSFTFTCADDSAITVIG